MNDLATYQFQLPDPIRRQLNYNIQNMNQLAQAAKTAMDIQADVYQHGWFTILSTVNQARFFLQAYQNLGNDDSDILSQALLKDLMVMVANYNQILSGKLQTILADMPTEVNRPGFWEELGNRLYELFFGERPSPENPIDTMLQLGTGARLEISNMAQTQLNNLQNILQRQELSKEVSRGT